MLVSPSLFIRVYEGQWVPQRHHLLSSMKTETVWTIRQQFGFNVKNFRRKICRSDRLKEDSV